MMQKNGFVVFLSKDQSLRMGDSFIPAFLSSSKANSSTYKKSCVPCN